MWKWKSAFSWFVDSELLNRMHGEINIKSDIDILTIWFVVYLLAKATGDNVFE
jgi:hypothetical protein